jgi:hypothetical protein
LKFVPNSVTRSIASSVLKAKVNSPHIFFVGGVIGIVGGTVLACRATLKVSETLEEFQDDISSVKALGESRKNEEGSEYDDGEYYRDLAYVYVKGTYNVAKLYGPAVVLGAISIAALTGSHVTLARRNTALTAALTTVTKAYDQYRKRVKAELGPEKELDIYHSVENKVVTLGDGSKEVVKIADPNSWSPYARFFDEASPYWEKNAELNRLFVQCQQNYTNNLLQARGHVFLNEVYDMFGIERSQAGQVVGWVLGEEGDNYVDFGMFDAYNRDFVNGAERSILLDFNVDGVVFHKIEDLK